MSPVKTWNVEIGCNLSTNEKLNFKRKSLREKCFRNANKHVIFLFQTNIHFSCFRVYQYNSANVYSQFPSQWLYHIIDVSKLQINQSCTGDDSVFSCVLKWILTCHFVKALSWKALRALNLCTFLEANNGNICSHFHGFCFAIMASKKDIE